ncbi:MAG TPA: S9 family peptidase [Thermoanaerobaculia bacterium]|nr:S9 family peptidase [Thermoanaerobaculia bacterium]
MKAARKWLSLSFLVFVSVLGGAQLGAELPPLIPRDVLFGNPERTTPQISPDGKRLAWLAPDRKNVLQVWVKTIGKDDDRAVTADKKRGIRTYSWAPDNKTLLYQQDNDGDENFHVYGVDLDAGTVRDYTAFQGVRGVIAKIEPGVPDQILVTMNARDRQLVDAYRLNLSTGSLVLEARNPGSARSFITDRNLTVIGAVQTMADGGLEILVRDNAQSPWRSLMKVGLEETLNVDDVSEDGKSLILESSIGTDTARVVEHNMATGAEKVMAASGEVDAGVVQINPATHAVEAVAFEPGRRSWTVIDPSVKADFEGIAKLNDGDFSILSRDVANKTWLVGFTSDRGPVRWYAWDREAKKGTLLFSAQPKLENLQLSAMQPVAIKTRDGFTMHAYLTLPTGLQAKNLPMVLLVHGGPWTRDRWGYRPTPQWLANRGYAVLQTNYRASSGFGKKFFNAGNRQWGLKMHDDLIDAANWAVKQGYADPKRIAIMGGSYGGYATLAGVAFTPEYFACGVDIVGPSNLRTLIQSIPPYWKADRVEFDARMGNIDDPADADLLRNASPLFKANQIRKPLLIGQGANDPRVNRAESERIVDAIQKNGGSVTYVVYSDEGHGFARPENSIDFNARAENFLSGCLGGRAEPIATGDRYPGSTATVKVIDKGKEVMKAAPAMTGGASKP